MQTCTSWSIRKRHAPEHGTKRAIQSISIRLNTPTRWKYCSSSPTKVKLGSRYPPGEAKFDERDGHLHLTRIPTSGNLVPTFRVEGQLMGNTSFYYIEPEVEQTISHLCLIREPRELIQVFAMFCLEQRRLFPKRIRGPQGLYPHTAARTFQLESANQTQAHAKAT